MRCIGRPSGASFVFGRRGSENTAHAAAPFGGAGGAGVENIFVHFGHFAFLPFGMTAGY
jgi:hypothetical protein